MSAEEVNRFIRYHVINEITLQLAESFAMAAIRGSAGILGPTTIAKGLLLDVTPEFVFQMDTESGNYLVYLERRSLTWQPASIPNALRGLILSDLVRIVVCK